MTIALLMVLPQLIAAGIATEQQIAALLKSSNPGMTEAEQATVLKFIKEDADRRLTISQQDAGPQIPQ